MIAYAQQLIDESDIRAVVDVLRSGYLTTGPKVVEFEEALAKFVDAKYAVAVSNGTAALHCMMYALGVGPDDEVIVPAMTFAATANSVVFQGAKPVFVDVDPDTLLIDPEQVEKKITSKTKAVVAVDYAGQPCSYDSLWQICDQQGVTLVADGCHALGAEYKGKKVGSLANMTVFSFHPVKHITTGEGGMVTAEDQEHARRMRNFRNHGITTDFREREKQGSWFYEMVDLGYNYRITDIQCALGHSQLSKLPEFLQRRRAVADYYHETLVDIPEVSPLTVQNNVNHAYHLYVVRVNFSALGLKREKVFQEMRNKGIGLNVHYIPVHLHPYYRRKFGTHSGQCPAAETAYGEIISLPMHHGLSDREAARVIETFLSLIR